MTFSLIFASFGDFLYMIFVGKIAKIGLSQGLPEVAVTDHWQRRQSFFGTNSDQLTLVIYVWFSLID
jgi:hypothetical protein